MGKLAKVATAYFIASFTAIVTGWVVALVWAEWTQTKVTTWFAIALVWLAVVGIPSLFAAANYLLKSFGARSWPTAWLTQKDTRLVSVGGGFNLAYSTPTINSFHGSSVIHNKAVELKELEIQAGHYVIDQSTLMSFLRTAWTRQRQGKDGLSRTWWVEKGKQLERGEYEAILQVLVREGLIRGRAQGRSGKLLMPPASTLHHLEERI
jgi:hypothetical protein